MQLAQTRRATCGQRCQAAAGERSRPGAGSRRPRERERYSYLYDPRSSVSLLVDQTGGVEESYGYSAYG